MDFPILSALIVTPLAGVVFILMIRGDDQQQVDANIRYVALWTSLAELLLAVFLLAKFDPTSAEFQFVENRVWLGEAIRYRLGVDGIAMPFILLTCFLTPLCILAGWRSIRQRVREYIICFLVLESLMVGVFVALDLLLFYLFFEGGLIPMFLIIGIWGGQGRIYAAFKFFLYTLVGSLLMLLAIMAMYWDAGTSNIQSLLAHDFPVSWQIWLWLAFFASLAVKLPMWPVHTWLPDAHVEAPTAGSMILAGILLKMGGYGFLRFCLPMFPIASDFFADFIFVLSVIAIIYTSLVALAQEDLKKLVAYSSVAHMGYVTLGLFSATAIGIAGGIFQMISHGLISAALFLCVGMVYERTRTRQIRQLGGIVQKMPIYIAILLFFTLANLGLPGTSGFIGEFLPLLGLFAVNIPMAVLGALGAILSAAYGLWLYKRVAYGSAGKMVQSMLDLNGIEITTIAPLVFLTLCFGIFPGLVLDLSAVSVDSLVEQYHQALEKYQLSLASDEAGQ